jgi:hypothetical protein
MLASNRLRLKMSVKNTAQPLWSLTENLAHFVLVKSNNQMHIDLTSSVGHHFSILLAHSIQ